MTLPPSNQGAAKPIILTGIVGALILAGIAAFMLMRDPNPPGPDAELPPAEATLAELPIKWSEHSDTSAPVQIIIGEQGPMLKRDALTIDLGLNIEGAQPFAWKSSTSEGTTILTGKSMLLDIPLTLQWVFKANDPQATLFIDITDAPLRALDQAITAHMNFPSNTSFEAMHHTMDVREVRSATTLGSWSPGWIKASLPGDGISTLTLSEWNLTAVHISPDAASNQISMSLWDPGSLPSFERCAEVTPARTVSIRQQLTVTLGERLTLVPSRHEQGYRAAIAPLFIDPASHAGKSYKDGRAKSAQDWIARGKTLLYGHSSEQDPRFGNGGLLGLGLGADLAMEQVWQKDPTVKSFSTQLEPMRARHLRRTTASGNQGEGMLLDAPDCDVFLAARSPYLTLGEERSMDQLDMLANPPSLQVNGETITRNHPNLLATTTPYLEIPQLSGRRQVLVDAVFSTQALDALIAQRGLMTFATPLVATRNPLTPGAAQALLEPERGGHWTLSEPLSRALTNAELINESHDLLITSPTQMITYWQRARQVRVLEMPDGSVALINPHDTPIEHFSMVASAHVNPVLPEGEELTGKDLVTARDGSSQTWFWWTLEPGTTRITLSEDAQNSALAPVDWQLQSP